METENPTQELEDKIYEHIVEAVESKNSMEDLKTHVGQTSLEWFLGKVKKREQARRKFFELRKVKREEKTVNQK